MWIVRLALRRPYTFVVLSLLLLVLGPLVIYRTPTDIFPNIDIPVISVVWHYSGLSAEQMTNRLISPYERSLTTVVNDIEHIESQNLTEVSVVKIFFQPSVDLGVALAQVTAISQTQIKQFPPGTTPPLVVIYNASSVPVIQLGLAGEGISEQQLFDYAQNAIRAQLATVQGASIPYPYGGKERQIQVDLNLAALQSKGLSPSDIVNAVSAQNIIVGAGTVKIGQFEYAVETNSSPTTLQALNDLPIKTQNGATVYIHDIAQVRDGYPPQTNIVRVDGQRAALMTIQKSGNASTLDIISRVLKRLPAVAATLPKALRITPLADQSIFVRAAISGVTREAIIAACLTGLMILLFLGSFRSTLIITISIPLSILSSMMLLSALGQTINIMTLGGLALAVGILVDDATVAIENINRNLEEGRELEQAILDGAAEIAVPALVSTLSICIVFVPMFLLSGVARYLFVPLAEAVVFAMLASYFFSRTLVPTLAKYLLKERSEETAQRRWASRNPFIRFQRKFEQVFERTRTGYGRLLSRCLEHTGLFIVAFFGFCLLSGFLFPWLGRDFFPTVDSGQFKIHLRAQTGTRIEETARICDEIDKAIRDLIPPHDLATIIDNIGIPYSGLNLSYSNSAPVGPEDADILVSLHQKHRPTIEYQRELRNQLTTRFPGVTFWYLPVDIVSQILNFGLPAPIDIQVIGNDQVADGRIADDILEQMRHVPGAVDLHIQQPFNEPTLTIDVDRTKSQQVGYSQRDIAQNILVALSGSFQTTPAFFLNPKNGVSYNIAVQAPQFQTDSIQGLENLPVSTGSNAQPQVLGNLATITRGTEPATITHYNVQPVVDVYGNVDRTDLASVAGEVNRIVQTERKTLPRGTQLTVRGQILTMHSSYVGLATGLVFAICLVYLLIVVNFQSWKDPFIIIAALPAALAGIVWFLFLTGTHVSVPALTGSIMCMGVATANSILVVSYAKDQMVAGKNSIQAAMNAGFTRFRPVLMTALAMIIGMVPMALGLGEGGEQNAPLGRAVIGGLLFATAATLFFVPVFFTVLHRRGKSSHSELHPGEAELAEAYAE